MSVPAKRYGIVKFDEMTAEFPRNELEKVAVRCVASEAPADQGARAELATENSTEPLQSPAALPVISNIIIHRLGTEQKHVTF